MHYANLIYCVMANFCDDLVEPVGSEEQRVFVIAE